MSSAPPITIRVLAFLGFVGAGLGSVLLLLPSRSPDLVESGAARADRRLPIPDELVANSTGRLAHVLLWFGIAVVGGLMVARWRSLMAMAMLLVGAAIGSEYAQDLVANSRNGNRGDLVADVVGILAGLTLVIAFRLLLHASRAIRAQR